MRLESGAIHASGQDSQLRSPQGRRMHATLSAAQARRAFAGIVAACAEQDELHEAFGYFCVDDGDVAGTLGAAVEERLLIVLGRDHLWPVSQCVDQWDDDALFDMWSSCTTTFPPACATLPDCTTSAAADGTTAISRLSRPAAGTGSW